MAYLDTIPDALRERGFTVRDVFFARGWHKAHRQGQAHLTFHVYKASR